MNGYGVSHFGTDPFGTTAGAAITLVSATATSTHTVVVLLSALPQIIQPIMPGDAQNIDIWTITRLDTMDTFTILRAQPSGLSVVLSVLEPLGPAQVVHRVQTTSLLNEFGDSISDPNFSLFRGVVDYNLSSAQRMISGLKIGPRDVANLSNVTNSWRGL